MERININNTDLLSGYDYLDQTRHDRAKSAYVAPSSAGMVALQAYNRIHKVYVGESGAKQLIDIYEILSLESDPTLLDAAGWAIAESALIESESTTLERVGMVQAAEQCWQKAIQAQGGLDELIPDEYVEDDSTFRLALNLAFSSMMKAIIAGNVTEVVRERTFADVLALAQLAGVQRNIAMAEGRSNSVTQLLGFEDECNAHLVLLYMNNPCFVPIPSSTRAGSGTIYPEQTHDIVVLNQHWGVIKKIIPIEIKSKASLSDLKRYNALVVRGKMHLSAIGKYAPEHTRASLAACYEGSPSKQDESTVQLVTSTLKELLQLYQQGLVQPGFDSPTKYHEHSALRKKRPEFTLDRQGKYKDSRTAV